MHHHYNDITEKIGEEPQWWDEHAVPRYCAFEPDACADIYADEVVLLLIACQNCGREFRVAMSTDSFDVLMNRERLADLIKSGAIHYGDPPNYECCPPGPTMNSEPLQVLEYWRKDRTAFEWKRDSALEVKIGEYD